MVAVFTEFSLSAYGLRGMRSDCLDLPDALGQLLAHIFVIDERVSFGVSCKYSLGILVAGLSSGSLVVRPNWIGSLVTSGIYLVRELWIQNIFG